MHTNIIRKIVFIILFFLFFVLGVFLHRYFNKFENKIVDLKQYLSLKYLEFKHHYSSIRDDIVILYIDETTSIDLSQYNSPGVKYWPLGRDDWARVIDYLEKSSPRVLSIAVPFTDYQDNALSTNSADIVLSKTLSKYDNIVLANSLSAPYSDTGKIPSTAFIDIPDNPFKPIRKSLDVTFADPVQEQNVTYFSYSPIPNIFVNNSSIGYLNQPVEQFNRLRSHVPIYRVISGSSVNYVPSFPFAIFLKYINYNDPINVSDKGIYIDNYFIPLSKNAEGLVTWYGLGRTYKHLPLSKFVIAANKSQNEITYEKSKIPLAFFKDKIVIIAPTSSNSGIYKTPVDSSLSGAEVYANILESYIRDSKLDNKNRIKLVRTLPKYIEYLIVGAVTLFLFANIISFRLSLISFLNSFVIIFMFILSNVIFYVHPSIRINYSILEALYLLFVVLALTYLFVFFDFSTKKRKIKSLYGSIVSDNILEQLINSPEPVKETAEKKKVSVLVCGIDNFADVAKRYSPQRAAEKINEVFAIASDVILKYHGTLNKIVGDSLIAYWGDPISSLSDSASAVKSAVEILSEVEKYNLLLSDSDVKINFSVSVTTDDAIVARIGVDKLSEYALLGEVVETARKMQSICSRFLKKILISESTYKEVSNFVQADYSGTISSYNSGAKIGIYAPKLEKDKND